MFWVIVVLSDLNVQASPPIKLLSKIFFWLRQFDITIGIAIRIGTYMKMKKIWLTKVLIAKENYALPDAGLP